MSCSTVRVCVHVCVRVCVRVCVCVCVCVLTFANHPLLPAAQEAPLSSPGETCSVSASAYLYVNTVESHDT